MVLGKFKACLEVLDDLFFQKRVKINEGSVKKDGIREQKDQKNRKKQFVTHAEKRFFHRVPFCCLPMSLRPSDLSSSVRKPLHEQAFSHREHCRPSRLSACQHPGAWKGCGPTPLF